MFQFTHPGRGATWLIYSTLLYPSVSIHAPREGCDLIVAWIEGKHIVSIHAPREGCDIPFLHRLKSVRSFNSRTPGGVRPLPQTSQGCCTEVSIHAPREGCDEYKTACDELHGVSIHAPREGCDACFPRRSLRLIRFQFTHPGRGATNSNDNNDPNNGFNSRTPGGVRPGLDAS